MTTYEVWCPGHGETVEDARTGEALDPGHAAELWAELDDATGDYLIVGGEVAEVVVRDPGGAETRWKVHGETVPTYYAKEVIRAAR